MYKKPVTARKGAFVPRGKGAMGVLPSQKAVSALTKGDPSRRTMQHYSKASPLVNPLADDPSSR